MATPPIPVLTVDRLPLVHAGVRQLLSTFPDIELVGESYTFGELLRQLIRRPGAIILVEIDDLGAEWSQQLQLLVRDAPQARVVVFTMEATPDRVSRALLAGVHGYLLKQAQPLTLAQALRSVAVGQQVLDPEATQAIMAPEPPGALLLDMLSRREREVLALLAAGLSNQAIGARLYLSPATIKFHCANLFTKLGVRTRSQAIAAAFANNLVPHLVPASDPQRLVTVGPPGERLARRA
jgi:DNA-binding NarL/FixJ family response regulator